MALKGYNLNGIDIPTFPADPLETAVNGRVYFNSTSKVVRIYKDGAWGDLVTNVTGIVAINHGGTGQITANAALNALLPSQSTHASQVLTTNGTNTSWTASGGSGANTSLTNLVSPVNINQPLNDSFGGLALSLDGRQATDNSNVTSFDWQARRTFDSSGILSSNYDTRRLIADDGSTVNLNYSNPSLVTVSSLEATGDIASATLTPANGATGTFTTADSQTVTVTNGIITSIV